MISIRRNSRLQLPLFLSYLLACTLSPLAFAEGPGSLSTAVASYDLAAVERDVAAVHQATVSAQTGGRIATINYDVDNFVEAGSVLVRFTDDEQRAALRQAQAQLAEAQARRNEAEEEYRRAANLKQRGLGSQRDLDRALAARDSAVARVAASRSSRVCADTATRGPWRPCGPTSRPWTRRPTRAS